MTIANEIAFFREQESQILNFIEDSKYTFEEDPVIFTSFEKAAVLLKDLLSKDLSEVKQNEQLEELNTLLLELQTHLKLAFEGQINSLKLKYLTRFTDQAGAFLQSHAPQLIRLDINGSEELNPFILLSQLEVHFDTTDEKKTKNEIIAGLESNESIAAQAKIFMDAGRIKLNELYYVSDNFKLLDCVSILVLRRNPLTKLPDLSNMTRLKEVYIEKMPLDAFPNLPLSVIQLQIDLNPTIFPPEAPPFLAQSKSNTFAGMILHDDDGKYGLSNRRIMNVEEYELLIHDLIERNHMLPQPPAKLDEFGLSSS